MAKRRKARKEAAPFDLTANPFYIIGTSVRARAEEITTAYEAALVDGLWPEDLVRQAYQQLTTPQSRLEAELSWLPGLSPEHATAAADLLDGPERKRDFAPFIFTGLDHANLYADFCYRGGGNDQFPDSCAGSLTMAYNDFDEGAIFEILAQNRTEAGLPNPDREAVREALLSLRRRHAKAALHGCNYQMRTNYSLVNWTKDFSNAKNERFIIEDVVREYIASEEKTLATLKDRMLTAITRLREDPAANAAVEEIKYVLLNWRLRMEPLQHIEASKGIDEPRSAELYQTLKALYTGLFGEGRRDLALVLAKLARARFNFLPAASNESNEAVRAMEGTR